MSQSSLQERVLPLLNHLKELSVRRIGKSYDTGTRLFCDRSVLRNGSLKNEGVSFRYSVISLLGLYRLQQSGGPSLIDLKEAAESLLEKASDIDNIGDVGLLLWLCSLYCPEHIGRLCTRVDMNSALKRYADARAGKTTELSWFLTGLSYASLDKINALPGLDGLAADTYRLLKDNYGGRGIFRHQNTRGFKGALRGRIGAFADQVYPVYAFTRFAQAYGNGEALDIALQCANTISALQGASGQWWWHYDAATGKVAGRYPVFSVHQHGMAPMALFAVSEASRREFDREINRGLDWITGGNELSVNMSDAQMDAVWRNIYRPTYRRQAEVLSSLVKGRNPENTPGDLKVLHECRPYCFGWFLYAFAGKLKGAD